MRFEHETEYLLFCLYIRIHICIMVARSNDKINDMRQNGWIVENSGLCQLAHTKSNEYSSKMINKKKWYEQTNKRTNVTLKFRGQNIRNGKLSDPSSGKHNILLSTNIRHVSVCVSALTCAISPHSGCMFAISCPLCTTIRFVRSVFKRWNSRDVYHVNMIT